jgi:predicted nucleic acid-binding protein
MPDKALVVDANILIRAVLGKRVREIIEKYADEVSFFLPESAFAEARENLAALVLEHRGTPEKAVALLDSLGSMMEVIGSEVYDKFEAEAKARLVRRDAEDWPVLAAALALGCPNWTEDTDFFGCGVATWTSDRVQRFLRR